MEEEEQRRSLLFLMSFVLLKRRRELNSADVQRRHEVQRRVRHRHFFFHRHRRTLMMMLSGGLRSAARVRTRPWTTTPSTDWWERVVMMEFAPSDWLDKFRMSRDTFFFVCGELRPRLARQDTSFRLALPVEKRVAVALWRLASNVEYRTISSLFGVGKSTVCRCVRDMCHAVVALLSPAYLRPPGRRELEESAEAFATKYGFPHCVGAVATLHTAIITPSSNAADYANPAGWLSVVSQVAVDGRGRFWDVCASFPGGTDPAEILQNSSLWASASEGGLSPTPPPSFMGKTLRYVLVGEPCYPLQPWLMTSYPEERRRSRRSGPRPAPSGPQRTFNRRLSGALRAASAALLRLRSRWQCLSKRNDCGLDVVPTMVLACCVLHNVCEAHGDAFRDEWRAEVAEAESPQPTYEQAAAPATSDADDTRRLFCDYFLEENH